MNGNVAFYGLSVIINLLDDVCIWDLVFAENPGASIVAADAD